MVGQVENDVTEITLEDGKKRNPAARVGDYIAEPLPPLNDRNEDLAAIYCYFLDMAGSAWKLYENGKATPCSVEQGCAPSNVTMAKW